MVSILINSNSIQFIIAVISVHKHTSIITRSFFPLMNDLVVVFAMKIARIEERQDIRKNINVAGGN